MTKRRRLAWLGLVIVCLGMMLSPIAANAASFAASKAGVKVSGSSYRLGSTSQAWKKKLGSYSRKKYDGCTAGTDSYMYTFKSKGVKVETLCTRKTGKEEIISIILTKSKVGTIAGLKVGNTLDRMEKLYGTDYKKSGSTCTYTAGKVQMAVKFSGSKIASITMIKDC